MKSIIIDGNNLIHKIPHIKKVFLKDKISGIESLIEALRGRLLGYSSIKIVFDGHGKSVSKEAEFSGSKTADELIRTEIENHSNPKTLKVISSDYYILGLAKACGCMFQKSEEFWKDVKTIVTDPPFIGNEKPENMSKKDLDLFRKFFT